jgi:hypothetical protein
MAASFSAPVRWRNSWDENQSEWLRPEFPPVQSGLPSYLVLQFVNPPRLFFREGRSLRNPVFSFDWNALRNGCALREDTLEACVMPMRRKVYPGIGITVAIDQPTESGEGQIEAIDGMREEHRVSFRGFDGPQVVEFDNEAIGFKKWRAGDLALIVESDWRTRKIECSARWDFVVPGDLAVLDP